MSDATLFESYDLAGLPLANRAVMAPMTRSRAIDNIPNELMASYYRQRAGAGLIVTEGTSPSPNGLGYPRIPGLFDETHADAWRLVTDAVHEEGGRIFVQLMHTGRVGHPGNLPVGGRVLAPSSVPLAETKVWVDAKRRVVETPEPDAMTDGDIEEAVEEFVRASRLAVEARFDGVELHAANGYLIEQFLHPHTNRRDDGWGGSWQARNRFALEVARRSAEAIGAGRVGIRVSPYGVFNEMPLHAEIDEAYVALAEGLGAIGLAYLHLFEGTGVPAVPAALKQKLRDAFGGTFILSGDYDLVRANHDLAQGRGDLIAFGRPFLANPDLLERYAAGAELNEPRTDRFYSPGAEGYTDYPRLDDVEERAGRAEMAVATETG